MKRTAAAYRFHCRLQIQAHHLALVIHSCRACLISLRLLRRQCPMPGYHLFFWFPVPKFTVMVTILIPIGILLAWHGCSVANCVTCQNQAWDDRMRLRAASGSSKWPQAVGPSCCAGVFVPHRRHCAPERAGGPVSGSWAENACSYLGRPRPVVLGIRQLPLSSAGAAAASQ